ncbi:hypothetical protein NHJ13734_002064 [Beauveria thailandica]
MPWYGWTRSFLTATSDQNNGLIGPNSVPINTGAEAAGHATLNTSTTARRRGAQPALPAHDNDEDAIIAASRALDEECPDGGYG